MLEWMGNLILVPLKYIIWTLRDLISFFVSAFTGPPLPLADPRDEISRFIAEFRTKYDTENILPWLEMSYNAAVSESRQSIKYLVVYLHNPTHYYTDEFVNNYLLSREFVDFIRGNDCLIWGASVRSSEGYKVSSALRDFDYPSIALLCTVEGRMTCVFRLTGIFTLESLLDGLRNTATTGQPMLDVLRNEQAQRELTTQLRREQEQDYERSLTADRARVQERRRIESERVEEAERVEETRRNEAERAQRLRDRKQRVASALSPEPRADESNVVRVAVRFPNGDKMERRFRPNDNLELLFDATFAHAECPDDFSLITSYPRVELRCAPAWYGEFSPTAADSTDNATSFRAAGLEGSVSVLVRNNEA